MTEMFFLLFDILVIKKVEIIIVDIIEIIAKNINLVLKTLLKSN